MKSTRLTWKPIGGASSYQLMVYDQTDAQTIFDETVSGFAHTVSLPEDRCSHDLSMRVRAMRGDAWGGWSEFEPLPPEVVLGERREGPPPLTAEEGPGLLLVFTIDTECSVLRQPNPDPERVVDELIFGDFGNGRRPGGIGLHMDLLEHFGFRGCFFVDVLMEFEHGQRALERTIEAIAERGHEIELHTHAEHLQWSSDPQAERLAADLSSGRGTQDPDLFRHLIELSVDLFERRVGRRPVAYRAGGYRIADIHFPILEEFGIRIDSSMQPYFNSRVSDWMRTRTQPFWVGGVLEIPPTFVLLTDRPDAWETRAFTPSSGLGDPISTLPAEPGGPPRVATFVSHSFQLLRCRQTSEPKAIEQFSERLRSAIPSDVAKRKLGWSSKEVRTFGEEIDDRLVAPVAGILRRIADRPDARCATYADLAGAIGRFWPVERHPQVDPIALLDRPQGIAGATGTRVFSRGLLSRLAGQTPARSPDDPDADPDWICGLERGGVAEFRDRLGSIAAELEPGKPLRIRLRTLGVVPAERRATLPPLAELLFPAAALRAVAGEVGAEEPDVLPWDASTFHMWLERRGFEIVSERRVPRGPEEVAALDDFAEKLRWLDPLELRTEALEVELRPRSAEVDTSPFHGQLIELQDGEPTATATMAAEVDPGLLPAVTAHLYESMYPGQELRLRMADKPEPTSRTTSLLALMRAGLEVLDWNGSSYQLLRPVDLPDIKRFAGVD
jgi:hypothetical protein